MYRCSIALGLLFLVAITICGCSTAGMAAFLDGYLDGYTASSRSYQSTNYGWGNLYLLKGAVIIANDGQLLGVITNNQYDTNSIANEYGKYGSKYSTTSIFNKYGRYGSQYSPLSPFSKFSSTPPRIYKGGVFVAYLTVNTIMSPRIDPIILIAWLKSNM